MAAELGVKAKANLRRMGYPWMIGNDLRVPPGPRLLLDWHYVLCGEIGVAGPYWGTAEDSPLPLRLWQSEEWRDRPVDARYFPRDVAQGVRIVAEEAEKLDPFPPERPPGRMIILDEGTYRTWCWPHEGSEDQSISHAESRDGLDWDDPAPCSFDWSASPGLEGTERPEIFLDPSAPEEERFKMFFRDGIPGGEEGKQKVVDEYLRTRPDDIHPLHENFEYVSAMWGAVSPDGIHWKGLPGPLALHYSDTTNVAYYDEQLERYVWYARCNWYYGRRCIGRAETPDFRRWPGPEMLVWPDAGAHPADDYYTNSKTVYPGSSDQHLMFPSLYHHYDDTSELRLFSSPDGIVWSEVPGGPVLTSGRPGTWDGGCVFGGGNLIPLSGDRVALPYGGYLYPHKYPRNPQSFKTQVAYAVWSRGRLGAIEAQEEGRFTTNPLVFEGRRLVLNHRTAHAGHVLVEVADRKGEALPGRSFAEADALAGDSLGDTVTWNGTGDLGAEPGQPVMLRFRLRATRLYSFEFV